MKNARKTRLIIDVIWFLLFTSFMVWLASSDFLGAGRSVKICLLAMYPVVLCAERVLASAVLNRAAKKKGEDVPFPKARDYFTY